MKALGSLDQLEIPACPCSDQGSGMASSSALQLAASLGRGLRPAGASRCWRAPAAGQDMATLVNGPVAHLSMQGQVSGPSVKVNGERRRVYVNDQYFLEHSGLGARGWVVGTELPSCLPGLFLGQRVVPAIY